MNVMHENLIGRRKLDQVVDLASEQFVQATDVLRLAPACRPPAPTIGLVGISRGLIAGSWWRLARGAYALVLACLEASYVALHTLDDIAPAVALARIAIGIFLFCDGTDRGV
jgi:hypothetical protein